MTALTGHIQSTSQQWKHQPSLTSSSSSSSSSSLESITAQEGDAIEAITSGFQWLKVAAESQLSWSDDDTVTDSPLVVTKADRRNNKTDAELPQQHTDTYNLNSRHQGTGNRRDLSSSSSPSSSSISSSAPSSSINSMGRRNKIRRRPESSSSSSSSSQSRSHGPSSISSRSGEDSEYQLKNSIDALVGSISAAINFCRHSGVPKPSILQLERNLKMKRYFAVMNRLQHYIGCVQSESIDEMLLKVHLAVTAWESLCRYESLEYKRAYKYVYLLRDANGDSSTAATSSSSSSASSASPKTQTVSESEIQRAVQLQIKLGEQCTACRKQLYLVCRWQRQIQELQMQRLKRKASTAAIEPAEGHQAIRCL